MKKQKDKAGDKNKSFDPSKKAQDKTSSGADKSA